MYEVMIHPVLTILFDLFIIGSALAVASAMVIGYLQSRGPQTGTTQRYQPKYAPAPRLRTRSTVHRVPAQRRRAA